VDRALSTAEESRRWVDSISRDIERLARRIGDVHLGFVLAEELKRALAQLEEDLLRVAARMMELWKVTHPPERKDPPKPDEDGRIRVGSGPFPPDLCASKKLCECKSTSKACDCPENWVCESCGQEPAPAPGMPGVRGLGTQVIPSGLAQILNQPKKAVVKDTIRENIYFAGEATVRNPGDSPAAGLGGHGPAIAPQASPSGAIPFLASPDEAPVSGGGKVEEVPITPNGIVEAGISVPSGSLHGRFVEQS
jgi:hypothetical protein